MAKLKWGMVGGGEGSQIGSAHRMAAGLDGKFDFVAGALDHRAEESKAYGQRLGLEPSRAYADWQTMLVGETSRDDRIDLVTVATPNATHFEITKAFLNAGVHVLCEKPMTMTVEESEEIVKVANDSGSVCAVNFAYSAFSLVRHMRAMIARGDLGRVRLVVVEFSHGHHADAEEQNNPRVRWRYDPELSGSSGQFADCGIHALHLACFVTQQSVAKVSADFASCIEGRVLEDDAMVNFRMGAGTVGRLWSSSVAIGRQHGLTIQVFGEKGGLRWIQEHPNQLMWNPLKGRVQIIERGEAGLSPEADRTSRITIGHAEGLPLAFGNIYADLAETIRARQQSTSPPETTDLYPKAEDGLHSAQVIRAAVDSAQQESRWIDV